MNEKENVLSVFSLENKMKKHKFLDSKTKYLFLFSILLMFMAHGFCFMNIMFSHDSLGFYDRGIYKVLLGRWLYPAFPAIRNFATPWLMGIVATVSVSLSVVLVVKVLDLNVLQGGCAAILFTTNITLTSLFSTYIYDADADCIALLLACFAVYSVEKMPKYWSYLMALVSLVLSLAIYQSYICAAAGLFLMVMIKKAKVANQWKTVGEILLYGIRVLGVLAFAAIIYVLLMHVMASVYHVALSNDYNGAGRLSDITLKNILKTIPSIYDSFMSVFFRISTCNETISNFWGLFFLFLLFVSLVIVLCQAREFMGRLVVILPCIILLPFALNAIYLVSHGLLHFLMTFAINLFLLLPSVLVDRTDGEKAGYKERIIINLTVLTIVVIGFFNIVYSNGAYVYKKLVYDNTLLHAQTIWKDVNSLNGYLEGRTQVVFLGTFTDSKAGYQSSVGERFNGYLTGSGNSAVTYEGTVRSFYYGILGRKMHIVDVDENELPNDVLVMPTYPAEGYCRFIGDKVVVKMSGR